jgi:GlpG protein
MTEPEAELQTDEPAAEPAPEATPWLTYAALAICVVVFAGRSFEPEPWNPETLRRWGVLDAWGVYDGGWWALLTSVFVHADVLHLAFNLFWLWMLGRALERAIGFRRSLLFFLGAAWVSSALQLAVADDAGIGFSGVGYALFGFMWVARARYPSFQPLIIPSVIYLFLGWLVFCIVVSHIGVLHVANTAHFAGLVFGALLGGAVLPRWRRVASVSAAFLGVASTVAVFWAPWSPSWHSFHAWKAGEQGDYERAIAGYTRAIELDAGFATAWTGRGQMRRSTGNYDAAIVDLSKAIELEPRQTPALVERGWVKILIEDYDGALADFERALEVDPGYVWAFGGINEVAWIRATSPDPKVRDPARAVELARQAVDLDPEEADYWNTLGAALYRAGQPAKALEALEMAMGLREGGDAFDWFFVAMARHALGRDDARVWYDRAVAWMQEHAPDDEELKRFRAEAEGVLGLRAK